jgi:hypothetical protein
MEIRKEPMFISRSKLFRNSVLFVVACSAMCIAQVRSNAPSSAQRQPPPPVQQTSPSGMLQPRQPTSVLRPALLENDVEHMTDAQFRALPTAAAVRYKGQTLTKSSYMELRLRDFQAQTRTAQPKASFEMIKARFQQQQAADLAAKNARAQTVMDAFDAGTKQIESSAAYAALEKEASDLQRRFAHSNAAQQAQLKQRALEIHNQLLDMEQRAK